MFDHLSALTDARGLFEHARYAVPRPEHGYCVDDVARALVVTAREPAPDARLIGLHRRYLGFTVAAVADDGRCHNRMDVTGRWTDQPGLGDWWGRALWGLGFAAARLPDPADRDRAADAFRRAAARRSPDLRATAFATLGAAELLTARPDEAAARGLLTDYLEWSRRWAPTGPQWAWPEPRLGYANAAIAEALIVAAHALGDDAGTARGCDLLDFLLRVESRVDRVGAGTGARLLSVTPVGGRGPGEVGPAFDQQPLEVAALADACASAHRVTGDASWLVGVELARRWLWGDNDSRTIMLDPDTGGGFDGLTRTGRNENQGAESTVAALVIVQQACALPVTP
ncbi:glycosyltransferase [Nakamurella flava]|uniref:Glycosyltransferase n=1 Tax=Nakamurella flava TaxID=2576308 RepID=A0A4U6QN62_9ACTN|nr:glycosyltransferase [Nakamurella flava]